MRLRTPASNVILRPSPDSASRSCPINSLPSRRAVAGLPDVVSTPSLRGRYPRDAPVLRLQAAVRDAILFLPHGDFYEILRGRADRGARPRAPPDLARAKDASAARFRVRRALPRWRTYVARWCGGIPVPSQHIEDPKKCKGVVRREGPGGVAGDADRASTLRPASRRS